LVGNYESLKSVSIELLVKSQYPNFVEEIFGNLINFGF